jgi:PHD/YefM family antitoxin component YafN of YafNO toxin-antitoxin module
MKKHDPNTMQATDLRKDLYNVLENVAASSEPVKIFKHKRCVAVLVSPSILRIWRKP